LHCSDLISGRPALPALELETSLSVALEELYGAGGVIDQDIAPCGDSEEGLVGERARALGTAGHVVD
jgi:hypothetical protein